MRRLRRKLSRCFLDKREGLGLGPEYPLKSQAWQNMSAVAAWEEARREFPVRSLGEGSCSKQWRERVEEGVDPWPPQ